MIFTRASREQCVAAALVGTVVVLVAFASGLGTTSTSVATANGHADPAPSLSLPATPLASPSAVGSPLAAGPIDGGSPPINYVGAAPSGSAPTPSTAPAASVATTPVTGRPTSPPTTRGAAGGTTPTGSPPTAGNASPPAAPSAGCPSALLYPLIGPLLPSLGGLSLLDATTGAAGSGSTGLLASLPVLPSPSLPSPITVPMSIPAGADPALGALAGLPAQCLTAISALVSATAGGS
jgi:hypothetical protein